ncbi:unnamed protein product [Dovyalis caffra]|uniref:Protein FAR1-RELATED SEQUENCE n=1 Tax=Dovyalis caffra TaxID=77055 RepID=A0AAV1RL41_9ROSI|nr:unnamed protein product [Dovyalis caffra]
MQRRRDKKKDCKLKMEDSYHETQGMCYEVNVDDVIIEENALYVNRSHNECDNLMGKVFNNEKEAYNFYNEYAIRTGFSVRRSKSRYSEWKVSRTSPKRVSMFQSSNAPSHLGGLNSNLDFQNLFHKCLKGCECEAEFEET